MGSVQLVVAPVALAATVVAVALVIWAVRRMVKVIRLGQPDPERFTAKGARLRTMLVETLGHTRMLRWTVVGAAHWFVMVGFGALVFTLAEAYGETFDPAFELPLIGHWAAYGLVKILVSLAWFVVIGLNLTMGVAWHRFAAFFNIFFKRSASARPALGGLRPMMSKGKPLDFEEADPDTDQFGVAKVEDFTWKGLLDFTTGTACGRCQSQCPAWNTGKPLSPKLLVLSLRDHAYAKAPYLLSEDPAARAEAERPLVGGAAEGGVIAPDVLWSCTTWCACVE